MAGHQLSHDEYKKCVNACVKVAIFGRVNEQLADDAELGDEGFDEGFDETDENISLSEIEKCGNATKQECIKDESSDDEIDHGSGFIIDGKHVITNKHVIEDALQDETKKIRISNAEIGEVLCVVVRYDVANDLALLYCKDLDFKQNGICPLQLSKEAQLLPSTSIFTLGYPMTYSGETALYVGGYVSGSLERYGREPLMVLNCPVNHGNSGGPVICRIKDELKVVAVIAQRHKKEIVTIEERNAIEEMRNSLPNNFSSDLTHNDKWKELTMKLFDALETHCQFNLCNAVPGRLVIGFIHRMQIWRPIYYSFICMLIILTSLILE